MTTFLPRYLNFGQNTNWEKEVSFGFIVSAVLDTHWTTTTIHNKLLKGREMQFGKSNCQTSKGTSGPSVLSISSERTFHSSPQPEHLICFPGASPLLALITHFLNWFCNPPNVFFLTTSLSRSQIMFKSGMSIGLDSVSQTFCSGE